MEECCTSNTVAVGLKMCVKMNHDAGKLRQATEREISGY